MSNAFIESPGSVAYLEKMQSQLPALELLVKMGWQYLTPPETEELRHHRLGASILEPVLVEHIQKQCRYEFKGQRHPFTENAVQNAVQKLKDFRASGATHENERAYDLLCLGTSVPQTVEGDTKSFTIDYIDWKHPENNSYHCAAEFKVERVGLDKHYVPDIVLFINGIPFVVIECKRSAYTQHKRPPIDIAIRQLADYQAKDGIPQVFLYSQLLMALARDKAEYGTTGTIRKFWSVWREDDIDAQIRAVLEREIDAAQIEKLLSEPFMNVRGRYQKVLKDGRELYEQDRQLYALCRPERLLELAYKFVLYDGGIKKIARYQQYFTVNDIVKRVLGAEAGRPRPGGVVWHTQGSGKSLTMVMLAKCLAIHPDILNPKVILVTDRIDLDDQICGTFRACGLEPRQAATGKDLLDLLVKQETEIITTLINKFSAASATKGRGGVTPSQRNTFVLVDEGHRSQYLGRHAQMRLSLKGACFIAFTGTPLAKSAKKNTFIQFGDLFKPAYTITRAISDKAVVPLVYEARHIPQPIDRKAIDSWFEKLTLGLTDEQKADLKRKFSTDKQLNKAAQKVRMIAWDVCRHYVSTYQGTGLKGQLVTPDKKTALLYKRITDEFGMVSTEVLISPPTEAEGENSSSGPTEEEKQYWKAMMDRYGTEKKMNQQLINAFKRGTEPEIIIVVDKLLTGFDAPCNTVLYLARTLKEHTLLQAIARVNRLFDGKEEGLILDYTGVIEELDEAIDFYAKLADFDRQDLAETVTYLADKAAKLPQMHSDVWELFGKVKGSKDPEVYEVHLRDDELRNKFYDRFGLFARTLALALSSTGFLESTPNKTIRKYRDDLKFFQNLRAAVGQRYQETISYSEYEQKIEKLIDTHVGAGDVQRLCEPINLFDDAERQKVMEGRGKSEDAQADMIASAARHVIEQQMPKDPVFYKKLSKVLEETLDAYHAGRLKAIEALPTFKDIATRAVTHTDDSVPDELKGKDMARRYYGCVDELLSPYMNGNHEIGVRIALQIVERIEKHKVRDWRTNNPDAVKKMGGEIDDILYEISGKCKLDIPVKKHDAVIDRCIEIAIANED